MARKLPDDVQKVFDKYTVNFVRRLNKDKALEMFDKEFGLSAERSKLMFDTFDKDRNDILSAWEFYHFYTTFGYDANKYLDKFNEMETGDGTVDAEKLLDFLSELKTMNGLSLEENDVVTHIMTVAGEKERSVDLNKFIALIGRIKLMRNYVPTGV